MAQVTLRYGCNDFGGTMLEENVVCAAGCIHLESIQTIERQIERAGFMPRRRNSWYGIVDQRHGRSAPPRPRGSAAAAPRAAPPCTARSAAADDGTRAGDAHAPARTRLARRARRAAGLGDVAEKVLAGERLRCDDGARLYARRDLHAVGALANHVRERLHGDLAYFNVNQHVNYTNICNKLCRFCAFQRLPGQEGAYLLTPEEAAAEDRASSSREPVTEVHMVAGIQPEDPLLRTTSTSCAR